MAKTKTDEMKLFNSVRIYMDMTRIEYPKKIKKELSRFVAVTISKHLGYVNPKKDFSEEEFKEYKSWKEKYGQYIDKELIEAIGFVMEQGLDPVNTAEFSCAVNIKLNPHKGWKAAKGFMADKKKDKKKKGAEEFDPNEAPDFISDPIKQINRILRSIKNNVELEDDDDDCKVKKGGKKKKKECFCDKATRNARSIGDTVIGGPMLFFADLLA